MAPSLEYFQVRLGVSMKMIFLALAMTLAGSGAAHAYELSCKNPFRTYEMSFAPGADELVFRGGRGGDDGTWRIINHISDDDGEAYVAQLPDEGVIALVHVAPKARVEFFHNGRQVGEDRCKDMSEPVVTAAAAVPSRSEALPFADMPSGFQDFATEGELLKELVQCRHPKVTTTPGMPDLWGCIYPGAEVVKLFINADGSGGVRNVKLMWNDWTRDVGDGLHADGDIAQLWLEAIAARYAPGAGGDLAAAFYRKENAVIEGQGVTLSYSYRRGPKIDERLITITEN